MPPVSRETFLSLLPSEADPALMVALHDILATDAVEQGLIGPRETPRLWDRHIANSGLVVVPGPGLVPQHSRVADVGSGAGLPGLVWAVARPDLSLTLIEPLLRRATFLEETVRRLGLTSRVGVVRGRAENLRGRYDWDFVTARAVAPLERLLGWTLPLVHDRGALLALKGVSAEDEMQRARRVLRQLGAGEPAIRVCGEEYTSAPTRVIVVPRRPSQKG